MICCRKCYLMNIGGVGWVLLLWILVFCSRFDFILVCV